MQPISIIGSVMKQIRPADSARVVVFLEQTQVRDGQGIMVRNIPDDTVLSPGFLLLSPSIIRRVPCVGPVLLEVSSHEESFPDHCCLLKGQALAFFDASRDNLDCQRLLWTMM